MQVNVIEVDTIDFLKGKAQEIVFGDKITFCDLIWDAFFVSKNEIYLFSDFKNTDKAVEAMPLPQKSCPSQ